MPYTVSNPPDAIKGLPKHAIEIWVSAYNSAFKQYNGDEAKSAGTAWAAVKMKYKQDKDGNWIAKESKEVEMSVKAPVKEVELSDENKRQLLQTALTDKYHLNPDQTIPRNLWVEDIFEDHVIYKVNDQAYKASYTIAEDGTIKFGDPEKVVKQTVYEPMEALQSKYAEVIQEVGRRNATLDAARVKKILQLCQELLSSEAPDEEKAKEAVKEADKTLVWLREQEVAKTEDEIKFPASAYAYVPDVEKASTWQLRMWEDLEKKVTKAQLGRVSASLSPGGLRGVKASIPSEALSAVKRKLRAAYRKLDVDEADVPKWVKESMTREMILNFVPLTEAKFDKGRATVVVIKPGFNAGDDRYYPAEMLKRDYKIFEGQKMFADHPTETEEKELPERSMRASWVAVLRDVKVDEAGVVTGVADIIEEWLMKKLAMLRDKGLLSEMGISINAVGHATKATIDGKETLVIEELTAARSVDFVTEPGAHGIVTLYEANRGNDIDLIELSILKERRPDLVKAIEAGVRAEITKEVRKAVENEERITELEGTITTLTKERDDLKEAGEKATELKVKAEAQATIKEAVDKAELPTAAKERLTERFKDALNADGIEEAITSEKDYIAALTESSKVKGLGPSAPVKDEDKIALRESMKLSNPDWTDAQLDTAVEGR